MNKKFLRKLIQAEIMKYEAIKELLPECTREKVEEAEKEILDEIKEMALEIFFEQEDEDKKPSPSKVKKVEII